MDRRDFIRTGAGVFLSAAFAGKARGDTPTMQGCIQYSRSIPVKVETDVFIAGGGSAGVAAAVAARSTGARVFLAEAFTCFGEQCGTAEPSAGLVRLSVPASGYAVVKWR